MTGVLIQRGNLDRDACRGKMTWSSSWEECHVKMEVRGMHLQAKECQIPTSKRTKKRQRRISLQVSEGAEPCWIFGFGLLISKTVRINFCFYCCYSVCDTLLQQSWEINTTCVDFYFIQTVVINYCYFLIWCIKFSIFCQRETVQADSCVHLTWPHYLWAFP